EFRATRPMPIGPATARATPAASACKRPSLSFPSRIRLAPGVMASPASFTARPTVTADEGSSDPLLAAVPVPAVSFTAVCVFAISSSFLMVRLDKEERSFVLRLGVLCQQVRDVLPFVFKRFPDRCQAVLTTLRARVIPSLFELEAA